MSEQAKFCPVGQTISYCDGCHWYSEEARSCVMFLFAQRLDSISWEVNKVENSIERMQS